MKASLCLARTDNTRVAGVDEAGRGPLAGPVVAAAVILPQNYENNNIRDSKKLSASKREQLYKKIIQEAESWCAVAVGPRRIERLNILWAANLAMKLAIARINPEVAMIDGNQPVKGIPCKQNTVIKGDDRYLEIAAASIVAKVTRDSLMQLIAKKYPGYGLEKHSGYPTRMHQQAIATIGPSRIHRKNFKGC